MVEVFKTNVEHPTQARMILEQIHAAYGQYAANFDLNDCDKILRVECPHAKVDTFELLTLLRNIGIEAQVLSD